MENMEFSGNFFKPEEIRESSWNFIRIQEIKKKNSLFNNFYLFN